MTDARRQRLRCGGSANTTSLSWNVSRLSRFEATPQTLSPLTLHWLEAWPGEIGDAVALRQSWQRTDDEYLTWSRTEAPGAGTAVAPETPITLSAYAFAAGDTLCPYTGVTHSDSVDVDGFAGALDAGLPLAGDDSEHQPTKKHFD